MSEDKVEGKELEAKRGRKRKGQVREGRVPLKLKAVKGVEVKETKFVLTATKDEKHMWVRGASVGLTHKVAGLKNFKPVTEEEAKKKHLGRTRVLGKASSQEELDEIVTKFFE
jgi:hypothetical protein